MELFKIEQILRFTASGNILWILHSDDLELRQPHTNYALVDRNHGQIIDADLPAAVSTINEAYGVSHGGVIVHDSAQYPIIHETIRPQKLFIITRFMYHQRIKKR